MTVNCQDIGHPNLTDRLTYNDFGPRGSYPPRPPDMCVWHFTVSYFPLGVFMLTTGKGKGLRLFPDFKFPTTETVQAVWQYSKAEEQKFFSIVSLLACSEAPPRPCLVPLCPSTLF